MRKIDYKSLVFLSALPLIYVSNTLEKALFVGVILLVVTMAIKGLTLLLNKYVEGRVALYSYLIIGAALLSILTIILNTYFILDEMIAVYLSLILLNSAIIKKDDEVLVLDQLLVSLASLLILIIIGGLREVLSSGQIEFVSLFTKTFKLFNPRYGITFFKDSSGGFILAGFVFGLFNLINLSAKEDEDNVL